MNKTPTIAGVIKDAFITERLIRGIKYRNMKTGDSIRLYYSPSFERRNMDVYQVKTKRQVIYDFNMYKEEASNKGRYMILGGILILAVAFLGYTDFNIFKFLMRLT